MSPAGGTPVAIAVVSTNLRNLLAACLESMRADFDAGRAEVWVVDNASTDGSPGMVRERFPWVKLVASESNLGYGRAINLVAERTTTDWVAPANEDIELRPGALERLIEAGSAHPEAAIVAPRLELPDGSTQHSVHSFPTLGFSLLFNLGVHRLSRRLADRWCIEGAWDSTRSREVPWSIATFMLVRRAAFEAVGGFSREQFIHSEDLDLGWRLDRAGWRTRFEPGATVFHVGSAASKKAFGEDLWSRWMAATYSWMARERGLPLTRAVAAVNVAGAATRWILLAPLARIAPRRFARSHAAARDWIRVHRTGLRPRAELLREH
ncbi:MAG: glycosyltransferase family 2 protein [Solirubrobacterales bacterium]